MFQFSLYKLNLTRELNEEFKRPVYWNEYTSKIKTKEANDQTLTIFPLNASFQGVSRLFVLDFNGTTQNVAGNPIHNTAKRFHSEIHRKIFLTRVDITKYNVLIEGRNFYDQPINDQVRKYGEIRNITTGKGDDCTTDCLLDYQYFNYHYQLTAPDPYKQKELDADPRVIQKIEFYGMLKTN